MALIRAKTPDKITIHFSVHQRKLTRVLEMFDEDITMLPNEREFKTQVIHRVMKKALPHHALVAKDAKSFVQDATVALIRSLTMQARKVAIEENRTKIKGQDLVQVFQNRGLLLYRNVLDSYLQVHHNREAASGSTETDAYDEDQNIEDIGVAMDHGVSDGTAPNDASDKNVLFDQMDSGTSSDLSGYFKFPEPGEQSFIDTIESDDMDPLGRLNDTDLFAEEHLTEDGANMPDSCVNLISHSSKNGAATSPHMLGATAGADPISDVLIPVSIPSWTVPSMSISGFVIPPIEIPSLTVQINNDGDLYGADVELLLAAPPPVEFPSHETRSASIPACTIPSTSVVSVRIPPVYIPEITAHGSEDTDVFGTDDGAADVGMMNSHEGGTGEESCELDPFSWSQDDIPGPHSGEHGLTHLSWVQSEQVPSQQEPYDPFWLDFQFDEYDTFPIT